MFPDFNRPTVHALKYRARAFQLVRQSAAAAGELSHPAAAGRAPPARHAAPAAAPATAATAPPTAALRQVPAARPRCPAGRAQHHQRG